MPSWLNVMTTFSLARGNAQIHFYFYFLLAPLREIETDGLYSVSVFYILVDDVVLFWFKAMFTIVDIDICE